MGFGLSCTTGDLMLVLSEKSTKHESTWWIAFASGSHWVCEIKKFSALWVIDFLIWMESRNQTLSRDASSVYISEREDLALLDTDRKSRAMHTICNHGNEVVEVLFEFWPANAAIDVRKLGSARRKQKTVRFLMEASSTVHRPGALLLGLIVCVPSLVVLTHPWFHCLSKITRTWHMIDTPSQFLKNINDWHWPFSRKKQEVNAKWRRFFLLRICVSWFLCQGLRNYREGTLNPCARLSRALAKFDSAILMTKIVDAYFNRGILNSTWGTMTAAWRIQQVMPYLPTYAMPKFILIVAMRFTNRQFWQGIQDYSRRLSLGRLRQCFVGRGKTYWSGEQKGRIDLEKSIQLNPSYDFAFYVLEMSTKQWEYEKAVDIIAWP